MSFDLQGPGRSTAMIPGAYERTTPTSRQPGAMGGSGVGSVTQRMIQSSMDAATIADREREGGGAPSQRRRKCTCSRRRGPRFAAPRTRAPGSQEGFNGSRYCVSPVDERRPARLDG
jgi:hypothetical protein